MKGSQFVLLIVVTMIVTSGLIAYSPIMSDNDSVLEQPERDAVGITDMEVASRERTSTFFENIGQITDYDIQYYGTIPGGLVGFGVSSIYLWSHGYVEPVILTFPDSSSVTPEGIEDVGFKTNYFLGDRGTYRDVSGYKNVQYQNLWSGIDLEFYATVEGAKYEFILEPYANPGDILLEVEGYERIVLSHSVVEIFKENSVIRDDGLEVYQDNQVIDSSFVKHSPNSFGVSVGEYDESKELVVDPLLYSTFVGGSDTESARAIEIDDDRNVYVLGTTGSSNLPTVDPYDTYSGGADTFVFKLNATGNGLEYLTYVGGTDSDDARGMALDADGNVYVTGETSSTDFPTVNAYDDARYSNPFDECFIYKLNAAGNDLLYSTYVNLTQEGQDIEVDSEGNMYVIGRGAIGHPIDPTHIFKMAANGTTLLYAYDYGDSFAESMALDDEGNVYVIGITDGSDFTPVNAYDDTFNGGSDVFALKLNATGNGLVYATYIGGTSDDRGYGITVDADGCAYLTGQTRAAGFPLVNGYDMTYGGSQDAYVLKLNETGNGLNYSTFIGGSGYEYGYDIVLDSHNNAYVAGEVISSDFPTVNAVDDSFNGDRDIPIFKLNSTGNGLMYSTYLGGSDLDYARGVALDNETSLYVAGAAESSNFPTVNAYDDTFNGGYYDVCVTKIPDLSDPDEDDLPNYNETLIGTDRFNPDSDFDLMPDGWEVWSELNPLVDDANDDLDNDTLTNLEEYYYGTFAFFHDTDFDLLPDPWEIQYGLDPLTVNTFEDPDQDFLENIDEFEAGTHPQLNDTDADFLLDSEELMRQCNPLHNDTDLDTILDGLEVHNYGTNPTSGDSDLDGLSDPDELFVHTSNPLSPDSDSDLMPDLWEVENSLEINIDDADEDPDEDQLTNLEEYQNGTDPHVADSDEDGAKDGWEVSNGFDPTDPTVSFNQVLLMNIGLVVVGIGGVVGVIIVVVVVLKRKR